MKALVLLFTLLGVAPAAFANLIKLDYSGQIDRMTHSECTNLVNGSCNSWDHTALNTSDFFAGNVINDSDIANGSFYFNTDLNYSLSADGYQSIYTDAVSDYTLKLGNTFVPNATLSRSNFGDSLSIVNDRPSGNSVYDSFFAQTWFSQGDWFASSYVSLSNRLGTLFDGFTVPTTLSMDDLTSATFRIGFLYRPTGDQLQISGSISDLSFSSVATVNEPPTTVLVLILLTLMMNRRVILS